jgi:hypothetical protein
MWELRRLTTLWASTPCYMHTFNLFTFFYSVWIIRPVRWIRSEVLRRWLYCRDCTAPRKTDCCLTGRCICIGFRIHYVIWPLVLKKVMELKNLYPTHAAKAFPKLFFFHSMPSLLAIVPMSSSRSSLAPPSICPAINHIPELSQMVAILLGSQSRQVFHYQIQATDLHTCWRRRGERLGVMGDCCLLGNCGSLLLLILHTFMML